MIRLSIVIATYNRSASLALTLDSLRGQTLNPALWEIVVVDNNCSDDTALRVETFARENPQLNVRRVVERRQGLSHARNCGMEAAAGDLFVVVDDDELIDPALARVYLDFFDANPQAAAAGGVVVPRYEGQPPHWLSPWTEEMISGSFYLGDNARPFGGGRCPRGGNFCLRRSMTERYGLFNTDLGRKGAQALSGEEKDLLGRLRDGGEQLWYLPGAIIEHMIPVSKLTEEYFDRAAFGVGVSEHIRTRSVSSWAYFMRLLAETVKWVGTLALALGFALRGHGVKGRYLVRMRANISRGLTGGG
jgi:glycosyltransferase involved in cell wall biosynthesis